MCMGVLATISPDINMMQIAVNRYTEEFLKNVDWKNEAQKQVRVLYRSVGKGAESARINDRCFERISGRAVFA